MFSTMVNVCNAFPVYCRCMHTLAVSITYTRLFHIVSVLFDFVSIGYFFISFFYFETPLIAFELFLGFYFLAEYVLLLIASEDRRAYVRHPLALSNVLIIIGYLVAPFWNLGILRFLRILRIIHLYQIIPDIRLITNRVIIWEKLFALIFHVFVLIFVISEIVFLFHAGNNSAIETRFDAFYFTTNAITQAGSDIELTGAGGRILTLLMAFLSVSVFVQIWDTAQQVQQAILRRKKKGRKKKLSQRDLREIYTEQYCTYCDIKNREKIKKVM